jgi:hypothetical protein
MTPTNSIGIIFASCEEKFLELAIDGAKVVIKSLE